ncbi:unnamed protein product [Microthlaspi erraticum]|uniref:DUF1985 domain-containing protein n=1 Tax=Microthlaspi erraticum TaxID=1685480 RepID=A0A6D2KWH8_9BRAS|nr:unnamed protein product [Microthlaspi erraticum]
MFSPPTVAVEEERQTHYRRRRLFPFLLRSILLMDAVTFPRRLFTEGEEPDYDRSVVYYSKNTALWSQMHTTLEDEWDELENSKLGPLFRFTKLEFNWASKVAQTMLTMQVACKKKYEIWSAVGVQPVRFSLNEFEHITGLNCEYKEALTKPETVNTDEMKDFWRKLGVNEKLGPSVDELLAACQWAGEWSREDRLRLGFLAVYAGFIDARKSSTHTRVALASQVMDLEKFENYPWGRVAFKTLIKSIKKADVSKPFSLEGFAEVVQVWAYYAMPRFGEENGDPRPNNPEPPLLAFNGIRGKRYVIGTMKKQVLFNHMVMVDKADVYPRWDKEIDDEKVDNIIKALLGEFGGGWVWKPADWVREGISVVKKVKFEKSVKSEKSHGKRSLSDEADDDEAISVKRARTSDGSPAEASGAGWKGLEAKIEELFKDFTKKHFEEMSKTQEKIQVLTAQVAVVGRIVKKLSHPQAQDSVKSSEDTAKSNEDSAKANEELEKKNEELEKKNEEKSDEEPDKSDAGEGKTAPPGGTEDTDCTWLRTHIPTDSEEAEEKRQQEEQIKAANVMARGKSERVRKLAFTQKGEFQGNSTARRIILNNPPEIPNSPPKSLKIISKPRKAAITKKAANPKKADPKKSPPPKKAARNHLLRRKQLIRRKHLNLRKQPVAMNL